MAKPMSNNRQMTAVEEEGQVFFFPKHNPPMSIRAASRKDAEKQLAALNRKDRE